ncbi:hypothetical protein ACGRHY_29315 [Streptomyces sp. HK10]|uniref:hypothetical protein n=1 Tax=Streptomyces sp. HK10 TaxID=3373255 RepID=UPI00374915DC
MNTTVPTASALTWRDRAGRTPVPPERWGRDHWRLLAYVETRTVDHHGLLRWDHLTLSHTNWPSLYAARAWTNRDYSHDAGETHPLRLRGSADGAPGVLPGHCEADALMDLADAGLITIEMPRPDAGGDYFLKPDGRPLAGQEYPSPRFTTGLAELQLMPFARFRLTDRGRAVADALRAHKAAGGAWSAFEPTRMG